MPHTHFRCPVSAPTAGEIHTPEHCVTSCRNRCLSPYLLTALAASNSRNIHRGRYISITSLTGCKRKLFAERNFDYAVEPKKALYAYRGTVMHTVLEDSTEWKGFDGKSLLDHGFLSEWNMKVGFCFQHGGFPLPEEIDATDHETWAQVECPGCYEAQTPIDKQEWFVLGGTLDGAEPYWDGGEVADAWDAEGAPINFRTIPAFDPTEGVLYMGLHDLKTMKEYAITKFICGDKEATLHTHTKDDYIFQANGYRYLGERAQPPAVLRERGVKQLRFVEARIQGFSMAEFPYMGSGYQYKLPYGKRTEKVWGIPAISFFDPEWVEERVKELGRPIYESLILEQSMGPVCEPESRKEGSHSWRCDFCAFPGSDVCPSAAVEYAALQEGLSPRKAYLRALDQRLSVA